ncbi:MAG: hypothetical protein GX640_11905, partial [Fibrobacter sp.]|nr:hypothetical protein [Fibrobacter sp.]
IQSDLTDLSSNMILPLYRGIQINSMNIVDGGIGLSVKDGYSKPMTSVGADDVIIVKGAMFTNGGILQAGKINIQDKMAPVITESQVTFMGSKDSLRVVFSEPVLSFTSTTPFQFKTNGGQTYTITLAAGGIVNGNVYIAEVESVERNLVITRGDSIWINPVASIGDNVSNIQGNPANRRVPIDVQERPNEIRIKVVNNPFRPDDIVPDFVKAAYLKQNRISPDRGMIVLVEPKDTMRTAVVFNGTISIYDVVKNPIVEKLPMVYDKDLQKLFFVWDGLNSKGRKVATGTYSAVLDYTYNKNNNQISERNIIRIGVKR